MKHTLSFIEFLIYFSTYLLIGCTTLVDGGNPDGHSIGFFLPSDTASLQNIIAIPAPTGSDSADEAHMLSLYSQRCGNYYVPNYPRLRQEDPLFFCTDQLRKEGKGYTEFDGDTYDLCELATSSKYIPLKNGYYMCYPYINFRESGNGILLNAQWKDICMIDFDTIQPLIDTKEIPRSVAYAKCYTITERRLVKLTGKSTIHFKGKSQEQITIDDVVSLFNQLLEDGTVEKFCTSVHYNK